MHTSCALAAIFIPENVVVHTHMPGARCVRVHHNAQRPLSAHNGHRPARQAIPHFFRRISMPTFRVEMFEGRTPEQKRNLVKAITQAAVDTLGSKPDGVDVIIYEIKKSDWATGGQLWSDKS
jgi:4-oxalocrotonate tautomerase